MCLVLCNVFLFFYFKGGVFLFYDEWSIIDFGGVMVILIIG